MNSIYVQYQFNTRNINNEPIAKRHRPSMTRDQGLPKFYDTSTQ